MASISPLLAFLTIQAIVATTVVFGFSMPLSTPTQAVLASPSFAPAMSAPSTAPATTPPSIVVPC